jgi:hypothetical protein
MIAKLLKTEYCNGTLGLRQCLEMHTIFCLYNNFDQIRQTNLIRVHCCNCGKLVLVPYHSIALTMFCDDCKDCPITTEHLEVLRQRLLTIKKQLIGI